MTIELNFHDPIWIISQIFAFFALITMFWSFQIKNKIKMMVLLGLGTMFLAFSAVFLENYTLTVLFGIAAVRNYVFSYIDWRISKGKYVAKWVPYFFAGVFIVSTVASTVILVYIIQVPIVGAWLEWLICITLIGLIIGNILEGTNLMRISFVVNRVFNIINHAYFNNAIAVIIATLTISSNIIFYIRQLIAWLKERKAAKLESEKEEVDDPEKT